MIGRRTGPYEQRRTLVERVRLAARAVRRLFTGGAPECACRVVREGGAVVARERMADCPLHGERS